MNNGRSKILTKAKNLPFALTKWRSGQLAGSYEPVDVIQRCKLKARRRAPWQQVVAGGCHIVEPGPIFLDPVEGIR